MQMLEKEIFFIFFCLHSVLRCIGSPFLVSEVEPQTWHTHISVKYKSYQKRQKKCAYFATKRQIIT